MMCKNCGAEGAQNYCPNCGQAAVLKRIDGHYILHEIEHVLHFEKGILYTIRGLLTKPGDTVRSFLTENRSRLVKPIIFLIITSLIYTVIDQFFHIEDNYIRFKGNAEKNVVFWLFSWMQQHYGYANLMIGAFIAGWLKLFFRKAPFNFFEILILLCFTIGIFMLIATVFLVIAGLTHLKISQIGGMIGIVYCSWAIGQFFDKQKRRSYAKAFGAYLLGMLTFVSILFFVGYLIDLVLKR